MKPHHYLGICLRVFAIVLFIYSLRQSTLLLATIYTGELNGTDVSISLLTGTFVIPLITAIICWMFPVTIAKKVIAPELDQDIEPMNYQSFLAVLILAIGVSLAFYVISDVVYWLNYTNIIHSGELDPDSKAAIITTGVEAVVVLILLGRAKTIAYQLLKFAQ